MNGYMDSKVAAPLLGLSPRHLRRKCIAGEIPGARKEGGRWFIPRSYDPRLVEQPCDSPAENLVKSGELTEIPESKRREALKKLGIIQAFFKFETAADKTKRTQAVGLFAAQKHINEKSLYRWLAAYRREGLRGLVDRRGGGKFIGEIISPGAFDLFKTLWLDLRRPSLRQSWLNLCFINKQEKKGWRIPSQGAMYQFVKEHIPYAQQVLLREGTKAYEARCAPYIERDPDSVEPGAVWIGDHSQFNCWIRDRGAWIRPWITAWEDMRSRKIVGFYISPCPNQTTILQAFKRAVEEYGPPESTKIDNGKDYDSEMWTGETKQARKRRVLSKGYLDQEMIAGIYAMMNVTVSFAIPYNAKAKPVERFFATLDSQFAKTIETYCSPDTQQRPEDLREKLENETTILQAYDLAGFGQAVGRYIEVYNNTAHTGAGMDGRSPAEVFETGRTRRVLAEGVAGLLLRVWSGAVKVGKNGVTIKGLRYGQYNSDLLMSQGKKVRAAYDPDDMAKVDIYDARTLQFITTAEQNRLIAYGKGVEEGDVRAAMREQRRAKRMLRGIGDAQLTANMDLTDLTLRAREAIAKETPAKQQPEIIKPVRTPFDDQVREQARQAVIKAVKRASGAESINTVLDMDFSLLKGGGDTRNDDLDIDLSLLNQGGEKMNLRLFENGW